MSSDKFYIAEFREAPDINRITQIEQHLTDAFGYDAYFFHDDRGILTRKYLKDGCSDLPLNGELVDSFVAEMEKKQFPESISSRVFYQILPMTPDYSPNIERGNIWVHYYLCRFLLYQEDIKNVYASYDEYSLGLEVNKKYAEELLTHFLRFGYFGKTANGQTLPSD